MIKIISTIIVGLLLSSCATPQYITIDSSEKKLLLDKGDRIQRQRIEPKNIETPWDGVVLSEQEYQRMQDIILEGNIDIID